MTSQEIEQWINENRPEPPRGSAVGDLSRPNYETFTEGGIRMSFVTAVDYDHLCHKYDEVCQQLRESEAARGEQMRTIEVLAAEVRAIRKCVEADPIYGWRDPCTVDRGEEPWLALGRARDNTNTHPPARRLVEEDSNG